MDTGLLNPFLGWRAGRKLNLPACIKWHSIIGRHWQQLDPHILQLMRNSTPPEFLVIHLGSNDVTTGGLASKKLIEEIQCTFLRYNALLPNTKVVWSSILPRLYWLGAPLNCGTQIDKKRKKMNRSFVLNFAGAVMMEHISQRRGITCTCVTYSGAIVISLQYSYRIPLGVFLGYVQIPNGIS